MTTKKKRAKRTKYLFNELDILIEKDSNNITEACPVAYRVRVLANRNELLPPATNIPTFDEAMQCAYMVKREIEKKRRQRFSTDRIAVLVGVETFIGKDTTLDRYIAGGYIAPCEEHIKAFIREDR